MYEYVPSQLSIFRRPWQNMSTKHTFKMYIQVSKRNIAQYLNKTDILTCILKHCKVPKTLTQNSHPKL